MFENIENVIEERKAESLFPTPIKVINEVVRIMETNPNAILYCDLSDYPRPRIVYETSLVLDDDKKLTIEIDEDLKKDDIRIELYDTNLSPGTPRDKSYCYRVNIFTGTAAEKIRGSTGHIIELLHGNFGVDNGKNIVTDTWTETNLTPKEVLGMLEKIKEVKLPDYDQYSKTETGTPRFYPVKN